MKKYEQLHDVPNEEEKKDDDDVRDIRKEFQQQAQTAGNESSPRAEKLRLAPGSERNIVGGGSKSRLLQSATSERQRRLSSLYAGERLRKNPGSVRLDGSGSFVFTCSDGSQEKVELASPANPGSLRLAPGVEPRVSSITPNRKIVDPDIEVSPASVPSPFYQLGAVRIGSTSIDHSGEITTTNDTGNNIDHSGEITTTNENNIDLLEAEVVNDMDVEVVTDVETMQEELHRLRGRLEEMREEQERRNQEQQEENPKVVVVAVEETSSKCNKTLWIVVAVLIIAGGITALFLSGVFDKAASIPLEVPPTPVFSEAPTFTTFVDLQAPSTTPLQGPTASPTIQSPTNTPTLPPTNALTPAPTLPPTRPPTPLPTKAPTPSPTLAPTLAPTPLPTRAPTLAPTLAPTVAPIPPTPSPTPGPTLPPTPGPTIAPTPAPTPNPTPAPTTHRPTRRPTPHPTSRPTPRPTRFPTPPPTRATSSPTQATLEILLTQYGPVNDKAMAWFQASTWQPPAEDPDRVYRMLERYALASLYFSTNGPFWSQKDNWLSFSEPVCKWFGRGTNDCSGPLTRLNLASNGLQGSIPPVLFGLTALTYLDLHSNQLTGSIPETLGNLGESLLELRLQTNQLTGRIPNSVANLGRLEWLYLQENQLTGSVPTIPFIDFACYLDDNCFRNIDNAISVNCRLMNNCT